MTAPPAAASRAGRMLVREVAETLLIALVFALFARTFLVQAFRIPTGSMEPDLLVGDHILVNKFVYAEEGEGPLARLLPARGLRRGDVVVFRYPEDPRRDFIKRCLALPGDTVEMRDKQLLVDGRPLDDSAYAVRRDPVTYPASPTLDPAWRLRDNFAPKTLGARQYFCLGDNRDQSNDSRYWGAVPRGYVKGRALLVYWSARVGDPGPEPRGLVARLLHRTRWERTLRLVR